MRSRIPALALALMGLLEARAGVRAQETGSNPPGTFAGVVRDSLSGLPVVEAAVSIEAGRAVLTDSSGRFVFRAAPKEGQVSLTVDQLGYASYFAMVEVTGPAPTVRLAPDSAILRGLKTVEAELRQAVGISANTRLYGRKELLASRARDLREFLLQHGANAALRGPFPRGAEDALQPGGGGPAQPLIYIDGWSFSGLSTLPTYELIDLYAVVFIRGGGNIRVWSTAYIERLARTMGHFR